MTLLVEEPPNQDDQVDARDASDWVFQTVGRGLSKMSKDHAAGDGEYGDGQQREYRFADGQCGGVGLSYHKVKSEAGPKGNGHDAGEGADRG